MILPENLFIQVLDLDLQQQFMDAAMKDSCYKEFEDYVKKNLKVWNDKRIEKINEQIFVDGKQYVPDEASLRMELVRRFHDTLPAGHPEELETYVKVSEHYWWPGIRKFIKAYVKGCDKCQQFKII